MYSLRYIKLDVQTQAPLHKNDYPIKSILHPQSILTFLVKL